MNVMKMSFGEILFLAVATIWLTAIFAGFAYLYWFVGIVDPRDPFGAALSNLGAAMVFPFGWLLALWNLWREF